MAKIRDNERSWAIELIGRINAFLEKNDLAIKHAGGENTISSDGQSMFPDVLLYGDNLRTVVLQGWELKTPDVSIENEAFIKDSQRKALTLNLNSCLIWNFTYAVLYLYFPHFFKWGYLIISPTYEFSLEYSPFLCQV